MSKAKPSASASSFANFGFEAKLWLEASQANLPHSRTLATLRDTPLPMLLSGELSLPAEALAQAGGARGNYPALPDRANRREMKP